MVKRVSARIVDASAMSVRPTVRGRFSQRESRRESRKFAEAEPLPRNQAVGQLVGVVGLAWKMDRENLAAALNSFTKSVGGVP